MAAKSGSVSRSGGRVIPGRTAFTRIDLATVWAEVRQQAGREFLAAATEVASRRVVFFIRYYPGLTVTDRVAYDGGHHDIEEVREIGRREGVELHTVAAG